MQVQNMPMPAKKTFGGFQKRGSKYDLSKLGVNDGTCLVLTDVLDPKKASSRLSSAVAQYRKAGNPGKFSIRTFTPEGTTQTLVGVWRVE